MGDRRLDAVDTLVGQNIRILRQDRGMSQTELGRKIDVTFQQVQKYENGTNRVGGGRLFKIASTFGVPITAFFEGAHETAHGARGRRPSPCWQNPLLYDCCKRFCAVENMDLRRSLAELAEQLAADRAPARGGLKPSARRERGPAGERTHAR